VAAHAMAPRGSTTGEFEAAVIEDAQAGHRLAAVRPAIEIVHTLLRPALRGHDAGDQGAVDGVLCALDGTPTKKVVGGNVCVATSMAVAKAAAAARRLPLCRHLGAPDRPRLPTPMFNVIDGSKDADCGVTGVEFLLIPDARLSIGDALEMGVAVRAGARELAARRGWRGGDSPQGALALSLDCCEEGLELLSRAAEGSGYAPGTDFSLGLDLASSDYRDGSRYRFRWYRRPGAARAAPADGFPVDVLLETYADWVGRYPLSFVEDGFGETDEEAWRRLTARLGPRVRVAGDDLFASSAARIAGGARGGLATAALVKPNQVGTVSEALEAMRVARAAGMTVVVSQRSGENDDAVITHLAVAGEAAYLKAGGMSRMDRVMNFNELLRLAA
ncbi:MAG TPA: phosphopyruvate hydratase, partial [Methylomirabilota bacterium]|nr:phosphopyruvate hydratase [Methylomirabilota bacterium]